MEARFATLCPYLGSWTDPSTSYFYPTNANACYASQEPGPIEKQYQVEFCLSPNHPNCRRYIASTKPRPTSA